MLRKDLLTDTSITRLSWRELPVDWISLTYGTPLSIVFSHDVTAAILASQNNETAAMLVSHTTPLGVELFSYANTVTIIIKPQHVIIKTGRTQTTYSRLPINRTFKGNRKNFELSGVRVVGSSKKIAGGMVENSFCRTVNILIPFYL